MKLVEDPDEFEAPERPGNVIHLRMITQLDMTAAKVLQAALDEDLDSAIVIGYRKGDSESRSPGDEYFASSIAAGDTVLWLLQRAIHKLIHIADEPPD